MEYDFELDYVKKEIQKRGAKNVLIQLPEGLKTYGKQILEELGSVCEPVLSAEPCFGACDIITMPDYLTVHFGHSEFNHPNTKDQPVIYANVKYLGSVLPVVEKALPQLGNKVGIITTAQHVHAIPEIKEFLKKNGKEGFTAKGRGFATQEAQILGCDVNAALAVAEDVDCFLYIGSGKFHPIGMSGKTQKPVIQANPYTNEVSEMKLSDWEKEMHIRKEKAHNAKSIAIITCSKLGQSFGSVEQIRKKIETDGRKSYVLNMDLITPDKLDYLPFDAFVITACPRIVLDDWKNYKKPILLPGEV
jgi:2-(3-amino-3-carboxypropyl)histidine synthase